MWKTTVTSAPRGSPPRVGPPGPASSTRPPSRTGRRAIRAHGTLRPDTDPDRLALALLAAVQGGLVLTQARRDVTPLAVALDTVLDHIRTFAAPPSAP